MIARNPVYFQRDVVCQWIERSIGQSNQGGCFLYLHYSLSSSSQPGCCTMRRDACARRRARLAFHPLFVPGEKTWQNSIAGAAPAGGVRRRTSILPKLNYHTSSEQPAPLMRIAKVLTFFFAASSHSGTITCVLGPYIGDGQFTASAVGKWNRGSMVNVRTAGCCISGRCSVPGRDAYSCRDSATQVPEELQGSESFPVPTSWFDGLHDECATRNRPTVLCTWPKGETSAPKLDLV
jgi:hypothetical protein